VTKVDSQAIDLGRAFDKGHNKHAFNRTYQICFTASCQVQDLLKDDFMSITAAQHESMSDICHCIWGSDFNFFLFLPLHVARTAAAAASW
jgi:hypothetical protein